MTKYLVAVQQPLCIGTPSRPTPDDYLTGSNVSIVSSSYGNGPCDGYAVQVSGIQSGGYNIQVNASPGLTTEAACDGTTTTFWVWHRINGGAWTYGGTRSMPGGWLVGCLTYTGITYDGPSGTYDVIVKAQARTEMGGYAYNRPVKVLARKNLE